MHAGQSLSIDLVCEDQYGNECDKEGQLTQTEVSALLTPNVPAQTTLEDQGSGRFRLRVQLQRSGDFALSIQAKNHATPITFQDISNEDGNVDIVDLCTKESFSVTVYPGVLDPAKCQVEMPPRTCTAGDTLHVTITTKDKYGNPTWHRPYPLTISAAYQHDSLPVLVTESPDSTVLSGSLVPITSGVLRVKVRYQTAVLTSSDIEVKPGLAHAPSCSVEGAGLFGCTVSKGEVQERYSVLTLCDFLGNPTSCTNINYTVTSSAIGKVRTEVTELSLGRYRLFYPVTAPGQYELHCAVEGTLLSGFPMKVIAWRDQREVQAELQQLREQELREQEAARAREEEERKRKLEEEQRKQAELEKAQRETAEHRLAQEEQRLARQRQREEELELERRRRIVEKLKKYQETQRRAEEALRALEAAHKEQREPQTWKRIGGGFKVPFVRPS